MHRIWTSELITSGLKPSASIARAVWKPNEPLPWPMSKITPRSRAALTSARMSWPWVTGALGKGRKQWVRISPLRSLGITSSWVGGGMSIWVMTGSCSSSAACRARSSGATPVPPPAIRPARTLTPTTRSRCSRAARTASAGSHKRRSPHSPTMTFWLKPKMPAKEMLR